MFRDTQQTIIFIAGFVAGGIFIFMFLLLLNRGSDEEIENTNARIEILQKQNRVLQLQNQLQDSVIEECKSVFRELNTVSE